MRRQIAFWCMVCLVGMVACGDDDALPSTNITRDEKVVGPAGATLALSDGTKVEIPAGALLEPITIVVHAVDQTKPVPDNLLRASKTYAFEPHGTLFAEPVKITLPFDEADGADNEERPIKLDDEDDDTWQTIVGADKSPGKLELETISFSFYVVARPNRASGVITLPDGATIPLDGGSDANMDANMMVPDANTLPDANTSDANALPDASTRPDASTSDAGSDASIDIAVGSFDDPNLELAVRMALGIATDPLTQANLNALTTLSTTNRHITSLVGLQHCHNLTSLAVYDGDFDDLRPIAGLTELTRLDMLGANMRGDITALSGLTRLTVLNFGNAPARGPLSALATLIALEELSIGTGNTLTGNISALSGLTHMVMLNVSSENLSGAVSALSGMTALQQLYIGPNITGTLSSLSPLTALTRLVFPVAMITGNISALSGMTNLEVLQAPSSINGALASISGLTNLQTLNLSSSSVTGSLSDLSAMSAMLYLDLPNTAVTGALSALASMTQLQGLNVASTNVSGDVSALSSKPNLLNVDLGFCTNVTGPLGAFASNTMLLTLNVSQTGVTMDFGPLAADAGTRAPTEITGTGNPIDCTEQTDNIELLRGLGFTIITNCDPI